VNAVTDKLDKAFSVIECRTDKPCVSVMKRRHGIVKVGDVICSRSKSRRRAFISAGGMPE
jgi:hypothetical protein